MSILVLLLRKRWRRVQPNKTSHTRWPMWCPPFGMAFTLATTFHSCNGPSSITLIKTFSECHATLPFWRFSRPIQWLKSSDGMLQIPSSMYSELRSCYCRWTLSWNFTAISGMSHISYCMWVTLSSWSLNLDRRARKLRNEHIKLLKNYETSQISQSLRESQISSQPPCNSVTTQTGYAFTGTLY